MVDYISNTGSDTETETDFKSLKSREFEKKRKMLPVPDDPDYTMDQFLHGIDPNLTSTQQSTQKALSQSSQDLFSQDLFSQETMDDSVMDTYSRTGSKPDYPESRASSIKKPRKKKRKSVAGF